MDIYRTKEAIDSSVYIESDENKNIYTNTLVNSFKKDAFVQTETIKKEKLLNTNFKQKSELKRAILLSEILARPKGFNHW